MPSDRFAHQCIVVAINARKRTDINNAGWDVYVRGGLRLQNTGVDAIALFNTLDERSHSSRCQVGRSLMMPV